MTIEEYRCGDYTISTDKARLHVGVIHDFLSRSAYWAQGRPLSTVQSSIENSLCFGVYAGPEQLGFARVVTDYATFAWLCDVFILEPNRGQNLGKWLIDCVTAHPDLRSLRGFLLAPTEHRQQLIPGGFNPEIYRIANRQHW